MTNETKTIEEELRNAINEMIDYERSEILASFKVQQMKQRLKSEPIHFICCPVGTESS